MNTAVEIGTNIGMAMAKDAIAEGVEDTRWTGIEDQDADQLTAAGIEPDTDEWDEAVEAARVAYIAAIG